ncbi:hypothetical protein BD780_003432 [Clostridium tetanomorphum]|uniref:DUF3842 family protein n=1 Tax=Clostridium tetanomorphum TaxID=1553 RepID=A0A923E9F5_CLOTT|nr:DUF3842 family protein [Clostridium tetanomorphum]MBC2397534.1 DUF3842 family protein [Clostridium tetanomorphum]MBP1863631.1 hypothetical protein [Clostridium tetanomorphum]NRS86207.1 hypothetical protein [Clostridium tetanomorphum]NRZ95714.1 hypothetical protein [Clostridium tetanomorphum]SQC00789.1 Domain of uncharacterised function (DUF3842) [Clostridium tetanomorphum]
MNIAIIDGQGAGIGQTVIKKIRKILGTHINIIALGTNIAATNNMIKAGADCGITGKEDICFFLKTNKVHCLIGPIGIICNGGINGEIDFNISKIIFEMHCTKYLIPLQKHGIYIPGTRNLQIKEFIEEIIYDIKNEVLG